MPVLPDEDFTDDVPDEETPSPEGPDQGEEESEDMSAKPVKHERGPARRIGKAAKDAKKRKRAAPAQQQRAKPSPSKAPQAARPVANAGRAPGSSRHIFTPPLKFQETFRVTIAEHNAFVDELHEYNRLAQQEGRLQHRSLSNFLRSKIGLPTTF